MDMATSLEMDNIYGKFYDFEKLKEPDVVIWANKASFLGQEDKSKTKRINILIKMLVDARI